MNGSQSVSEKLKQAKLWDGSLLDQADRYGCLTLKMLQEKVAQLVRCDDRTPKENELLRLLRAELG